MQLHIALECSASSAPTSIINVFYEDFCVLVIKRSRLHAPSVMLWVWSRKVWEENSVLKSFGIPGPQIRLSETRRLLGAVSKQPSGVKRICFQLMYKGISVQRALQNSRAPWSASLHYMHFYTWHNSWKTIVLQRTPGRWRALQDKRARSPLLASMNMPSVDLLPFYF